MLLSDRPIDDRYRHLPDEGWFEVANPPTYPYAPGVGVNFTDNLSVETLDFGTLHAYPEVCVSPYLQF